MERMGRKARGIPHARPFQGRPHISGGGRGGGGGARKYPPTDCMAVERDSGVSGTGG